MTESTKTLNVAAYKFVELDSLQELREQLRLRGVAAGLKGTILLSPEGINLFLAGESSQLRQFIDQLRSDVRFSGLEAKESWTEDQPFRRFLVKLKREIIAFGIDEIRPEKYTSPRVTAEELKGWLDEGRPVHLLDVRNDYEIEVGTFEHAQTLGIDHFRDFPDAIERLPEQWKSEPIVTFCTGGIRCEKAAPLMEDRGFSNVYQLDGGILKYFEEVGERHYDGECFVFDHRVTVGPTLEPSDKKMCFACQSILSSDDLTSPKYVPAVSCPHCYKDEQQSLAERLENRQRNWNRVTDPLPGIEPYDHERPLRVSQRYDGLAVEQFLESITTHMSSAEWQDVVARGRLTLREEPVTPDTKLNAGDILIHLQAAHREPVVNANLKFLFEDDDWIVIDKPAPLPVHSGGRFHRHTLTYLLDQVYAPERIRPVHRLDAATTGVMILARHRRAAAGLQQLFKQGQVDKEYLVRVNGDVAQTKQRCNLSISAEAVDGLRRIDPNGLAAETEFDLVQQLGDGTSLLIARPKTGRTNQIRLHAWALGFPVINDPMYLQGGQTKPYSAPATEQETLGLHAWRLSFPHPLTGDHIAFEAPLPTWAETSVNR